MSVKIEYDKQFFSKLGENMRRETEAMLNEITSVIQANIRVGLENKHLVDTGNLVNSYQRSVSFFGNRGIGIVGSNAIHALPMELGITKRFKPSSSMIEALGKWAQRKLGVTGKDAIRAGRAIAWKIARRGLPSGNSRFTPYTVRDAFTRSSAVVPMIIERHMRRAMALSEGQSS